MVSRSRNRTSCSIRRRTPTDWKRCWGNTISRMSAAPIRISSNLRPSRSRSSRRAAAELEPILHSFQDKELLRIGVRDILGKRTTSDTTRALSDLAETILQQIAAAQYPPLVRRLGLPTLTEGPRANQPSRYVLL